MSGSSEVLTPILLRSSTPAPSEKVLLYLEGIQRSGGASPVRDSMFTDSAQSEHGFDPDDPRLKRLHSLPRAPSQHRSSGLSRHAYNAEGDLRDLENSELSYGMIDAAEIASDVQEGLRSDIGKSERSASVHGGQGDHRHAGQEDEPGPKYASGSSFGNLGLPRESFFGPAPTHPPTQPAWFASGTPSRAANVALPGESEMMSPPSQYKAPWSQAMLRQTGRASAMSPQGRAAVMSPGTADVNIGIEPPTDPSRQSSKEPSRAPSRHSRRSSGGRHDVTSPTPSQAQAQQQQLPGITVNINPDGSTTISIPRNSPAVEKAPTERAPTERAPTEKAYSEAPDEMRSPKARSQRPSASVVGSRRPSGGEADPLFSPGAQSRAMKSPKAASRAPSHGPAPSHVASQMSPIGSFKPLNGFQSFGYPPPEENNTAAPAQSQKAPSQWAQSTRAPSQRPAQSQNEPSEVGTIPNEFTGGTGFDQAPHDETRGSSAYDDYDQGGYPHDQMNGYASNVLRNNATTISGTTRSGSAQRSPLPMPLPPHMHKGLASSMDSRNSRPKMPVLSPVPSAPNTLRTNGDDPLATPTQSRAPTPEEDDLNDYETEIVQGILSARTPRTSIAPSLLAEEIKRSNYHDEDLCILLHAADDTTQHEIVRKALRKAVAARIRKLGLKSDKESIRQYQKKFHNHDPSWHTTNGPSFNPDDPPAWAREMMEQLQSMESRVAALGPQLAKLKKSDGSRTRSQSHTYRSRNQGMTETADEWERTPRTQPRNNGMTETVDEWERTPRTQTRNNGLTETVDEWDRTPRTQTIPIGTQMTGADESMYRNADTEYTVPEESIPPTTQGSMHQLAESQVGPAVTEGDEFEDEETRTEGRNGHRRAYTDRTGPTETDFLSYRKRGDLLSSSGRGESPGQQVLEEELYRLRIKEQARSTAMTHQSWELHEESVNGRPDSRVPESEIPDIEEELPRADSPPLPPIPVESQTAVNADSATNERQWQPEYHEAPPTPPWQRIHQRLLNWAIVWPMSELDNAMTSTQRGAQADEVALSIWSTQMYKRYVRQQLTEVPPGRVDRLFVPPNMADAINNAVFHGRHGDACGMLRDLWMPFGLEGMPRIIVVLCKHRSDPNHWVAHKFSLPDGTLTTYDTYPEKCLPDGRPLGWWFAIRIAWPGAMYPSPDHLMQKMVRLHRPTQLSIDNSVAAAGIWRNLLMGSRAERPVDLERLRDLINTEVKNLRQRKEQGKLSVAAAIRQNWNWEDSAS